MTDNSKRTFSFSFKMPFVSFNFKSGDAVHEADKDIHEAEAIGQIAKTVSAIFSSMFGDNSLPFTKSPAGSNGSSKEKFTPGGRRSPTA